LLQLIRLNGLLLNRRELGTQLVNQASGRFPFVL
jgi:hypothetical protein